MNCKIIFYLFLGNKKLKMNNGFIPVGELDLDVSDMHWYLYESFYYNIDKEMPFMKLLLDMTSVRMKFYTQGGHCLLLPQAILNLGYTSAMLTRSSIKIKSLSEDLFCTGDIQTLDYCMEVYSQFLSNEPWDFFISGCWEIDLACQCMERELEKIIIELEKIFHLFYSLIPNESKF